jgi:two-component system, chemotaxis family, chemotaxis protein CheY
MKRILIIEDCKFTTSTLKEILKREGYNVVGQATTGAEGIEMAYELEPDVVTIDNMLPDMTGIDVVKELQKEIENCKIVMISSLTDDNIIKEALKNGASKYLVKPFTASQLKESLEEIQ